MADVLPLDFILYIDLLDSNLTGFYSVFDGLVVVWLLVPREDEPWLRIKCL